MSLEMARKSLSGGSIPSSSGQEIKILVNTPFNFSLYHDLALQGQAIPIPYLYTRVSWRCMVRTLSCRNVPICIRPSNEEANMYLAVRVLENIDTDEQREIEENFRKVFCADLNLSCFYERASSDVDFLPTVRKLIGLKPCLSHDVFEALIKAVIRQLVHADSARHSISMLVVRFGERRVVERKDYYSFPSPEELSRATKNELMSCRVGYKWKLIKQLASDVSSGDLDLHELARLGTEKAIEILSEYKGIGYWTSRIFLYDGLKRLDAYPIRDISLQKAISLIYFRGRPVSWDEVEQFFEYYTDYVGIAAIYLFGVLWLKRSERLS